MREFFLFFSAYGIYKYIWGVIIAIYFLLLGKKSIKLVAPLIVTVAISYLMSIIVLKNIFRLARPEILDKAYRFCPSDYSFPSGHATIAFTAATVLSFYDKKRAPLYYSIAILIAYSRVYLDCHFALDVIAGAILGYTVARIVLNKKIRNLITP